MGCNLAKPVITNTKFVCFWYYNFSGKWRRGVCLGRHDGVGRDFGFLVSPLSKTTLVSIFSSSDMKTHFSSTYGQDSVLLLRIPLISYSTWVLEQRLSIPVAEQLQGSPQGAFHGPFTPGPLVLLSFYTSHNSLHTVILCIWSTWESFPFLNLSLTLKKFTCLSHFASAIVFTVMPLKCPSFCLVILCKIFILSYHFHHFKSALGELEFFQLPGPKTTCSWVWCEWGPGSPLHTVWRTESHSDLMKIVCLS